MIKRVIRELQAKAQAIKKDDKGMGKAIDKLKADVREDERAITSTNIALGLIRLGKNALEEIASVCNLSLEQVQSLADTVKA